MNRDYAEEWLNNLKEYWINKDIENAVSLFKKTTFYQETPFMDPYTTLDEIRKEWQHIKNENIQNIEFKVLAIDNLTIIAEWILKQNDNYYDGIYEIKFNENLECIYFKSWEMLNQTEFNENLSKNIDSNQMFRYTYNKLVRDKIPENIDNEPGRKCKYRILNDNEYLTELNRKVLEEANEFVEENSIEELGDLMEVIHTIMKLKGYRQDDVYRAMRARLIRKVALIEKYI